MYKLFKSQEIRFLFVGGLNTLVGYGLYALFLYIKIPYLVANTFSTIIGICHSYLWNRFFTFKSTQNAIKEIPKFLFVYGISYLISTVTLYFFVNNLNINQYIAGAINLFTTTIISWLGHKYFSFKVKN